MQDLIEQFIELSKRISFKDIRFNNWYGIGDKYQASFPSQMELLRTQILTKIKPNNKEFRKWQFIFDDIFPPLNRIHYQTGLPKSLKGIGLGYKLYKALIYKLGWGCSEQNATPEAQRVWEKLFMDSDIIAFRSKNNDYLALSLSVDSDERASVLRQWEEFYKIKTNTEVLSNQKIIVVRESVYTAIDNKLYRNTDENFLYNLLKNGSIKSKGKDFISLSLKENSGGQDNYGNVRITFNSKELENQGAIELWYDDVDFWKQYPDITKHVTGFNNADEYYQNNEYENEEDFEKRGQNDFNTSSWLGLLDTYSPEAEVVIPKITMGPNLIENVKFEKDPEEKTKLLLNKWNINWNLKGDD